MNEDLLGNCRACGRQVSFRAVWCPGCGEEQPTWTKQELEEWKELRHKQVEDRFRDNIEKDEADHREFAASIINGGCLLVIVSILLVVFIYFLL